MRLDKLFPTKGVADPVSGVLHLSLVSGHIDLYNGPDFDLYVEGGVFFAVRQGCVAYIASHGTGIISGAGGRALAEKLAAKYPRPKPLEEAK